MRRHQVTTTVVTPDAGVNTPLGRDLNSLPCAVCSRDTPVRGQHGVASIVVLFTFVAAVEDPNAAPTVACLRLLPAPDATHRRRQAPNVLYDIYRGS